MMVNREGDLSSEISKVEREDTPQKVSDRRNYVIKNIKHCCSVLFETEHEIKETKSIILTTKPCYYFFLNQSDEYDYMEWVEFEEKVSEKVL